MRQCRESAASRRRLFAAVLGAAVSCAVAGGCGGSAAAGDAAASTDYAEFSGAVPVTITGYTGDAMEPFISKDGRYLFFNNRNDPALDTNIFYASRIDDATFRFLGAVPGVNSPSLDAVPSLDLLGNFYFVSTRSYTTTLATIYSGAFSATGVTDVALVTGVSRDTPGAVNFDAEISADGDTLWFDDGEYSAQGGLEAASIAVGRRDGLGFTRAADSATQLAAVNVSGLNYAPSISVDGLELFFTRVATMSGGAEPAIYRATRPDTAAPFADVERVSAATGFVEAPSLSADGHVLYFHKLVGGRYRIYCAQR
jgi:Tol biopolymer transport system component